MTERSGRRRFRMIAAALVVSLWLLAAVAILGRGSDPEPVAIELVGTLTIDGPGVVNVGDAFTVSVGNVAGNESVELSLDAGYGPNRFEALAVDGVARFDIDAGSIPGAGVVVVEAYATASHGSTTLEAVPGAAVDALDLYLGPRTVVADSEDFSMVVAVPADSFGNPVATGTPVDFLVTHAQRAPARQTSETRGLLAFTEVVSGTLAGQTTIGVTVDEAQGPERSFLEVAGVPVDIELSADEAVPVADGATLLEVRTSVLADEFANVVPDGTFALLDARGATGLRRISGSSIDGVVTFVVEAPDEPGLVELTAFVEGAISEPLSVDFKPAVTDLPVTITGGEAGVEVVVSRVTSTDGAYVPDGTVAEVRVDDQLYELELELGQATLQLTDTTAPISVTVLGVPASRIEDLR